MAGRSALCLAAGLATSSGESFQGYLSSHREGQPRREVVHAPTGVELLAGRVLPEKFDWRNHGGRNWVTSDVNQHIPQYCGSCWIHGTTAHINDRMKIMRHGAFPDVMLSRQALLNCVPGPNHTAPPGCQGGDSYLIYEYMLETPVPDETCHVWKAKNEECTPYNVCTNCNMPAGFLDATANGVDTSGWDFMAGCFAVDNFLGYQITEYGRVNGTDAMMSEIYARGPIACTLDGHDPFMLHYEDTAVQNEGVYYKPENLENVTDHCVEIAGWGTTPNGVDYWIGRNSWGTYWGEEGWFKIAKGINQNNVEMDCSWALPKANDIDASLQGQIMGDYHAGVHPVHVTALGEAGPAISEAAQAPAAQIPLPNVAVLLATLVVGALGGYLAPRRAGPVLPNQLLG